MNMTTKVALLPYAEAKRFPDGTCDRCQQPRPLFLHEQTVSRYEEHDCEDCGGHDVEETVFRRLCARCWSDTPVTVEEP